MSRTGLRHCEVRLWIRLSPLGRGRDLPRPVFCLRTPNVGVRWCRGSRICRRLPVQRTRLRRRGGGRTRFSRTAMALQSRHCRSSTRDRPSMSRPSPGQNRRTVRSLPARGCLAAWGCRWCPLPGRASRSDVPIGGAAELVRARGQHVLERIRYSRCSGGQRPARMRADSAGTSLRSFAARWQMPGLRGLPRWRRGCHLNFEFAETAAGSGSGAVSKNAAAYSRRDLVILFLQRRLFGLCASRKSGLGRKRSRSRQNTAVNHGSVGFCHRQTINSPRFLC